MCKFIEETQESVVQSISVTDVLAGHAAMPFTSRVSWISSQRECPDLRRVHAHLSQGTRPSKKVTNIRDVKRYLKVALIARDGLLVVKDDQPFTSRERIIVPRPIVGGILTALHFRLATSF